MWPSLDDLQDLIRVSYKSLNGRNIATIQQPDILALLSVDCFVAAYVFVISELFQLDKENQAATYGQVPASTLESVLSDAEHRGYLECRAVQNKAKLAVKDRCSILYEVFIDLQASRLRTGNVVFDHLNVVPRCEELEEEQRAQIEEKMSEVEKAVNVKTNPKDSLNERLIKIVENGDARWTEMNTKFKGNFPYLLIPNLKKRLGDLNKLKGLTEQVQAEYNSRLSVMLMRLEVTAQSFLYSDRAKASYDEVCSLLSALNAWVEDHKSRNALNLYDLISADRRLLAPIRVSSRTIPSSLKKIQVGSVPNRGGVPEGFAALDVNKDVQKANIALQQKDARELQAKKRAETEWLGGAAAAVAPAKKTVWKAPPPGADTHGGLGNRQAETQGGVYHGFSQGYARRGRQRFPGVDAREAMGAHTRELPYIAEPQPRAPTVGQSQRVVYTEPAPTRRVVGWGGRPQDQSSLGWDPRRFA
eukprot:Gregarina_sp_Pseudo_9__2061@NODE_242_length_3454_cov_5_530307_g226_i0_p2_GENE_NODE_242_length_3454_cov_5_530307_g226_i0NODE_242_length_3454_cov_5_530307_g226_i0_p2_ORF_typecomplete_len474_score107_60DUF2465/PF10239_9/1_2e25Phasin/PF05597_11/1_6_NODE_242_length_3454_cov_5_530307_g226_i018593280